GTYVPSDVTSAAPTINSDMGIMAAPPANPLCVSGSLIKLPSDNNALTVEDSAVYYCGQDGKRYVFPTLGVFLSWYDGFSAIVEIPVETMAQIALGGNARYRPGVRMVKLQTDPKTYAVAPGGVLRWVTTETIAEQLYGQLWNTKI